jgi:hypothetical protein
MNRYGSLVLGLALAAALLASSAGSAKLPPPKGVEPIGTSAWPAVAARLAKNIAKASFAHDYGRVWAYLHPAYRQAVPESRWHRCQAAHPAAPRSVTVSKVSVVSATELAVDLSLFGRQNVQDIELLVLFKSSAAAAVERAILYTFWLKQGKTWRAVWPSDEYAAYKAGKCYVTPQGPPLY